MKGIIKFIKEAKEEIKKVTWPTKKETFKYAVIVITSSFAVAVFLGGVDIIVTSILQRIM